MTIQRKVLVAMFCLDLILGRSGVVVAAQTAKPERPKLYDTNADGKEQIATALKTAKTENKRILLKFGANW